MAQDAVGTAPSILVIGGSAGSLDVLLRVLPALRGAPPFAIVIVLHRKHAESVLDQLLADLSGLDVKEAEEKESIEAGKVYLAPADYHLLIENSRSFSLDFSEKLHYSRPSIDATFETAADAFGSSLCALLLSGANDDGTQGLRYVKAKGGRTMVQDPEEASVPYMPGHALREVEVDAVLTTEAIIGWINAFI